MRTRPSAWGQTERKKPRSSRQSVSAVDRNINGSNENGLYSRDRVTHAPDVSATATYSRTDCDTGGTERRPVQRSEVAHFKEHRRTNAPRTHVATAGRLAAN